MAEDICIAVGGADAEVYARRPVPLILDRVDGQHGIAQPELDGTLVGFMTGITFNAKFHN